MHNYYTLLYNRVVFEAVESVRGTGEAVLFARSATVGGQSFPVHWGGDCESTYPSMAESLRGGLSLGMSGFGFWSHDIGGFEGTPSATLFTRWLQFGLLSSHARLHGSTSYRVPWAFGEEAVRVARDFTRMRMTLMPYLWNAAIEAHSSGIPVMRSMLLEFPEDRTSSQLDRQYMLGGDVLVAPVFADSGEVEYYLPAGEWIGFLDGAVRAGGRWVAETYAVDALPMLVRPGSVIPVGAVEDRPDYDYAAGLTLEVFGLADGASATASVADSAGGIVAEFEVTRSGGELTASVVSGAEALGAGWSLRWVTGPLGTDRGAVASSSGEASITLAI
jgi:alpha-D-xyloside xylohydrolase